MSVEVIFTYSRKCISSEIRKFVRGLKTGMNAFFKCFPHLEKWIALSDLKWEINLMAFVPAVFPPLGCPKFFSFDFFYFCS